MPASVVAERPMIEGVTTSAFRPERQCWSRAFSNHWSAVLRGRQDRNGRTRTTQDARGVEARTAARDGGGSRDHAAQRRHRDRHRVDHDDRRRRSPGQAGRPREHPVDRTGLRGPSKRSRPSGTATTIRRISPDSSSPCSSCSGNQLPDGDHCIDQRCWCSARAVSRVPRMPSLRRRSNSVSSRTGSNESRRQWPFLVVVAHDEIHARRELPAALSMPDGGRGSRSQG